MDRAAWMAGLSALIVLGCSSTPDRNQTGTDGGPTGTSANGLAGVWDVVLGPMPGSGGTTTVTIAQNAISITSRDFSLTATRAGQVLSFTDEQTPGHPNDNVVLTATQTTAAFDAGIVPFDLGGSWTMQIVPAGQSTAMNCTLSVSATEIDGACQKVGSSGLDFGFTTVKMSSAASSFGDLGGTWMNTWITPGPNGGTYPCQLDFMGNGVMTCPLGAMNGPSSGSPLPGITFTYDGANAVSGAAQGWSEFSATRR